MKELELMAADFVTDVLFAGASEPDWYRGRFFPERRKIRNLTNYIKIESRCSKIDQNQFPMLITSVIIN